MKFDEGALEDLKASLRVVGQIYSVLTCKQHPDRVLAGRHRREAGMGKPYLLDVEDRAQKFGCSHEEMEQLILIHSNVQRQVSKAERYEELNAYAKLLETQGVAKHEIASKIASKVPFSEQYVFELLPEEFKSPEKVEAGRKGGAEKSAKLSLAKSSISEPEIKEDFNKTGLREPTSYPGPSQSDGRQSEYTEAHVSLLNALTKRRLNCRSEVAFERPGELTSEGQPKTYQSDIVVEDRVIVEVEGEGSSSRDNEKRDFFFKEQGFVVKHIPNDLAQKYPEFVADLIQLMSKPPENHHIFFRDGEIYHNNAKLLSESFETLGPSKVSVKVELPKAPVSEKDA